VVFLINPHNEAAGSLDTLCLTAVAAEPAMRCVESYFACLREQGEKIAANTAKAMMRAFIASRDRPEVSLGVAAKRGYFPLHSAAFDSVRQLLTML
jgi:hypothetical protein